MTLRRKILIVILLLATVAGGGWWRTHAAWTAMIELVDATQQQLEERDGDRPVLWGEGEEGRAFEEYGKALAVVSDVIKADRDFADRIHQWSENPEDADAKEVEAVLAKLRPVFAAMRRGAHRSNPCRAIEWKKGFASLGQNVIDLVNIAEIATLAVRQQIEKGETRAAVHTALDLLQFGRDLMDDPSLLHGHIGVAMMAELVHRVFLARVDKTKADPVLPESRLGRLTAEDLEVLARGLQLLERPLTPLGRTIAGESVALGRQVQLPQGVAGAFGGVAMPMAWRFGFSIRWLVGDAVRQLHQVAVDLQGGTGLWSDVRVLLDAKQSELRESYNPLMQMLSFNLRPAEITRREAIARLRLLQMAVLDELGRSKSLADPFGDRLQSADVEGRRRYWSVGEDGVDDCGSVTKDVVLVR